MDRVRRKPVMILSNLLRAIIIGLIPFLAVINALRLDHLYLVAFAVGVLQVLFELAFQSYLPSLVGKERLIEGNSKLQSSFAAAEIGGPGVAGALFQLVTGPLALLVNSFSYLLSAFTLSSIRKSEPEPSVAFEGKIFAEITQGIKVVATNPYLRAMAGEAATYNLFFTAFETIFILYALREIGLSPAIFGLAIGIGGVGSFAGSLLATALSKRQSLGRSMLVSYSIALIPPLAIPFVGGTLVFVVPAFLTLFFVMGIGLAMTQIYVWSLRQAIVPSELLGRTNSAYRFFITGVVPLGALLGGYMGETIGLQPTLILMSAVVAVALAWIVFSPIKSLKMLPTSK